jgi:16S rRNA (uracil1498-N3)-methyltransferase
VRKGRALGILLHETRGGTTLREALVSVRGGAKNDPALCAIAVGTEGGMSDDEIQLFIDVGFARVHFATNILRVDTAALYGMAALQTACMEEFQCKSNE